MKVKEETEKAGLKFNIQKAKIMASGPITSWEIDGETVETETTFIFLGSKFRLLTLTSHLKPRLTYQLNIEFPFECLKGSQY